MIFYICNGENPRCSEDANCRIHSPLGSCFHTVNPSFAKHQELTNEEGFKAAFEAGKFSRVKFGPSVQFWEKSDVDVFE